MIDFDEFLTVLFNNGTFIFWTTFIFSFFCFKIYDEMNKRYKKHKK